MRIAETLGKSLEDVMQLSVLEIELWYEWFRLQQEQIKNGNTNNRHSRSR